MLRLFLSSLFSLLPTNNQQLTQGGTPDILSAARQVLIDWNHHKIPFYSDPPVLHASHVPSTIHLNDGTEQVAPGATLPTQLSVSAKSDKFVPPMATRVMFSVVDSVFVSVMVWLALVVPVGWLANVKLAGGNRMTSRFTWPAMLVTMVKLDAV